MLKLSPQQFSPIVVALKNAGDAKGSDKRLCTRIEVQTQLKMGMLRGDQIERCFTVLARDISCTGVGLLLHAPLKSGETFVLCFPCPKVSMFIVCAATFCRPLADGLFTLGAQFESMAEAGLIGQFQKFQALAAA